MSSNNKEHMAEGGANSEACHDNPTSPEGSTGGVSSTEEDEMVERTKSGSGSEEELIPVPPPVSKGGITILGHKLWIGNLDRRLTE